MSTRPLTRALVVGALALVVAAALAVDPDGRVVRHDQGGDTVSEGQAYAMLVAVAVGDHDTFTRVWAWTQQHLRRPAETLSWR